MGQTGCHKLFKKINDAIQQNMHFLLKYKQNFN